MTKSPVVYVVVLNWNNGTDTIRCIESLFVCDYQHLNVVLCDNGSTDASVELIESWARAHAVSCVSLQKEDASVYKGRETDVRMTLIKNGENLGYARGNNVGIRFALSRKADYVLVLNNDTTLSPSAISHLVTFGRLHPDAALMAPRILQPLDGDFVDSDPAGWQNSPNLSLNLMSPWLKTRPDPASKDLLETSPLRLYYAPGCAMMFRSHTFTTVGLFDEKTFLYYEEFIMGEKLKRAGLVTYYVPDAEVYHLQGATTAKITPAHKYIYAIKSQKYYFRHYQQVGFFPMAALSLKVTLAFLFRALVNDGYRRNLIRFFRSYY